MRLQNIKKIVVSAISATVVFLIIAVGISFFLPPETQSGNVGYQIQLLNITGGRFYLILAGIFIFMVVWSFIYFNVQISLPGPVWTKGLLFGVLALFISFWLQHRFYLSLLYRDWTAGLFGSDLLALLAASAVAGVIMAVIQGKG